MKAFLLGLVVGFLLAATRKAGPEAYMKIPVRKQPQHYLH